MKKINDKNDSIEKLKNGEEVVLELVKEEGISLHYAGLNND